MGIYDRDTTGAHGAFMDDLKGQRVVDVHPVIDSDRGEFVLELNNGKFIVISCDPGYDENDQRTDDRWEVVLYDATDVL